MKNKTKNLTTIRDENLNLLNEWISLFFRKEIVYKNLRQMFGASPECEVNDIMGKIFLQYTNLVAEKVGDKDNWLDWFLYDNDAGRNGFEAKASSWKEMRKIQTIENLLDLIENKSDNK